VDILSISSSSNFTNDDDIIKIMMEEATETNIIETRKSISGAQLIKEQTNYKTPYHDRHNIKKIIISM
jgi:hypothetical protein